jgi:GTPase SAR1 family protein
MSAIKILISGEANAGKTTLTKNLKNALLLSHDGKKPVVQIPHVYVNTFTAVADLISLFNEKIAAYNNKFGSYPETIVIDSISRIYDTIGNNCNDKYTGFTIYSAIDKEIKELNSYIEDVLIASDINVILISHALYDSETSQYNLVGKGSYAKLGGALSIVEEALFLEKKPTKRVVHFRSTKFPARTLIEDLPDSISADDFNMQTYLESVIANQAAADSFAL